MEVLSRWIVSPTKARISRLEKENEEVTLSYFEDAFNESAHRMDEGSARFCQIKYSNEAIDIEIFKLDVVSSTLFQNSSKAAIVGSKFML